MIFAATVKGKGVTEGTYKVSPLYTRIDGTDALDIEALPMFNLEPADGDIVYCAEGINDFAQSMQLLINDNGGAFPLIFASISKELVFDCTTMQFKGKITLGEGGKKMLLGEPTQTWAQAIDAAVQALYTWAATGAPPVVIPPGGGTSGGIAPFPGTPPLQTWQTTNLSENHQLD